MLFAQLCPSTRLQLPCVRLLFPVSRPSRRLQSWQDVVGPESLRPPTAVRSVRTSCSMLVRLVRLVCIPLTALPLTRPSLRSPLAPRPWRPLIPVPRHVG